MSISSSGFTSTTPLTSKGDILSHDGTSTVRIPVGSNGQVVIARSTATIGSAWETAATQPTGEYLLIGSSYITANTATVSFTSLDASYKVFILTGVARSSDTDSRIAVKYNGSGARSLSYTAYNDGGGGVSVLTVNETSAVDLRVYGSSSSANAAGLFGFFRYEFRTASGGDSKASSVGFLSGTANRTAMTEAYFQTQGAASQISVFPASFASFVSGSKVLLFGIK
jgi:hypothetical protein